MSKNQLNLSTLTQLIINKKFSFTSSIIIFFLVGALIAFLDKDKYRSESILVTNDQNEEIDLSGASAFSSLAGVAGINLPEAKTSQAQIGIAIIRSHDFFKTSILNEEILIFLIAAESWDKENDEIVIDKKVYDVVSKKWIRKPSSLRGSIPTSVEAHEKFLEIINIQQDRETGLIKISADTISPKISKKLVENIIQEVNIKKRDEDIKESYKKIKFLEDEIKKSKIEDVKAGLSQLIKKEISKIAIANTTDEYIFKILDSASMPEEKIKPNRLLTIILFTIIGGIIGLAIILLGPRKK